MKGRGYAVQKYVLVGGYGIGEHCTYRLTRREKREAAAFTTSSRQT